MRFPEFSILVIRGYILYSLHNPIAYVANSNDNTLSVIDGKTNKMIATIAAGQSPNAVSINPNTNIAYVANYGSNTISIINVTTNNKIKDIPVGQSPNAVSM